MTLSTNLRQLLNLDEELMTKVYNSLKNSLSNDDYNRLSNIVDSELKYLKPIYDFKDFEKQRDMISCILFSTIGQKSMDWINEWSDIPYEMFTGTEPNSYEYDQIKLFVENYYNLMKETNHLEMEIGQQNYQ